MKNSILDTLKIVFETNKPYIGEFKINIIEDQKKLAKWISSFLVRRVKREILTEEMKIKKINSILAKEYKSNEELRSLENKGLIFYVNEYVLISELGIIVQLLALKDTENFEAMGIEHYIEQAYILLAQGLNQHQAGKVSKLFPQGLTAKEITFVIFLLLNGAYNTKSSFLIRETSNGIIDNIEPIMNSLQNINERLFNEHSFLEMKNGEFSNFLRRNTSNGTIGRVFTNYYKHTYDKVNQQRKIYFDIVDLDYDKDNVIAKLFDVLTIIIDSLNNLIDRDMFLKNLRETIVEYILQNPLAPHEQLNFFQNMNYRDSLYLFLTVIDERLNNL